MTDRQESDEITQNLDDCTEEELNVSPTELLSGAMQSATTSGDQLMKTLGLASSEQLLSGFDKIASSSGEAMSAASSLLSGDYDSVKKVVASALANGAPEAQKLIEGINKALSEQASDLRLRMSNGRNTLDLKAVEHMNLYLDKVSKTGLGDSKSVNLGDVGVQVNQIKGVEVAKAEPTEGGSKSKSNEQFKGVDLLPPNTGVSQHGSIDNSANDKPLVIVSSVDYKEGDKSWKQMHVFVVQPGEKTPDGVDVDGIVTDDRVKPIKGPDGKWYPPAEMPEDAKIKKIGDGTTAVIDKDGNITDSNGTVTRNAMETGIGMLGYLGQKIVRKTAQELGRPLERFTDTTAKEMSTPPQEEYKNHSIKPYKSKK